MLVSGKCRVRVDAGCAVAGALVVALLALGVLVAVGPAGACVGLTWLVSEPRGTGHGNEVRQR